ncbi:glycosyltransferase [Pseudoxanthomonas winnipegensis]|uniref:glycosyltransferase n=1 Tax=Pseudoxanthomonas winnipegensis TaxID=2480810 RepID=UPI0025751564|nr:glycosyltransferase [Pseudoxanthomonas winnipegensis]WJI16257.1 glycosyltransferase [Pseudoxanthomonas winnipegensis]
MEVNPAGGRAMPQVSVLIPVKNAAWIIDRVVNEVERQVTRWPFEIIVIDSGSTDGTLELLQQHEGVRVVQIAPEDYGHGRTRNLGVQMARGEYVALLTHDAIPADEHWLDNLVAPLEKDPAVAGVFGRHVAHDNASACARRDLDLHFENLRQAGELLWVDDFQRYQDDLGYRQLLHFYSDNNSCLRKSVWETIPYPDVDFAEDQLWAKAIIERGYRKAYAFDAVVKHSHDYSPLQTFQRSFDEAKAFKSYFGYTLGGRLRGALGGGMRAGLCDYRYTRVNAGASRRAAYEAYGNQVAKHLGHWLGARSERLPTWVQHGVSLDMKLKHGQFSLVSGLRRFISIARQDGFRPAVARMLSAASRGVDPITPEVDARNDVTGFFRAVLAPASIDPSHPVLRQGASATAPLDMLWFIPDFGEGSGGHLNIFRFMRGLEGMGMRMGVVIVGSNSHVNHALAKAKISRFFGVIAADVYFGEDELPPAQRIMATSWLTAHFAKHYQSPGVQRFYFIQDYEPLFYPAGFDAAAASETYLLGFKAICAGSWIPRELEDRHGVKALGHFGFSYDHDNYRALPKRDEIRRVFFYARPPTARRGFELGLLALDLVGRMRPDVHFIFAGWDISNYRFDHVHLNGGVLKTSELPDLYSQCDVALILSFSNMSLLPYEVMACNCAVVSNDDACATWGLNEEVATFAPATPEALAGAIVDLLDHPEKRRAQIEAASAFVAKTNWDSEIKHVYDLLIAPGAA